MNSNLLLAVKAKVFSFMLAAGNPFDGAGYLARDFQGNFVKVSMIILAAGAVVVWLFYGLGGQEMKSKMKSKLFSIIVAVVGTAAIVGGVVTWLFDTSRGWFGG